jgi:hypothetical protein
MDRRLPLKLGDIPATVYQFVDNITDHELRCPPGELRVGYRPKPGCGKTAHVVHGTDVVLSTTNASAPADDCNTHACGCSYTGVPNSMRHTDCPANVAKLGGRESIVYLDYIVNNYHR